MSTVCLYDPDTNIFRDIPARELSSDCIMVNIEGHGEAYVEVEKLKEAEAPRHEHLPEELRARIRLLRAIFKDVCPDTLEKWEHDFKKDARPEREVAIWEHIAATFKHFTKKAGLQKKKAIFEVALKCSMVAKPEEVPMIVSSETLETLGRKVEEVTTHYFKQAA